MSTGCQINDQEGLHYLAFQFAGIGYWFAMENGVIGSRRLQFRSGEVKKTIAVNLRKAYALSGLIFNVLTITQGVALC